MTLSIALLIYEFIDVFVSLFLSSKQIDFVSGRNGWKILAAGKFSSVFPLNLLF
jgi:hypothetical protein